MKWMRLSLLAGTLALCAPAADITGTWKAVFLAPQEKWPKTVSKMVFDLQTDGTALSGTAHIGSWPGEAPISGGKIDGDLISFTVIGKLPWRSSGPQGAASGYPRLSFSGTISGKEMHLTLVWDSILIYGNVNSATEWQMQGQKIAD